MLTITHTGFAAETDAQPPSDHRWYLLRTRSRQEQILANELRSMGLSHCLPLVGRRRRFGACDAAVRVPLFPQYLFLRGSPLDAEFAMRTSRVTDLQEVPDASGLARELRNVCRAIDSGASCEVVALPSGGASVRVQRGPLAGIDGLCDTAVPFALLVPVTCMGQALSVEIDPACIEKVATRIR